MEYKVKESYLIEIDNYSLTIKINGNKVYTIIKLIRILNLKPAIIRMINPLLKIKLINGITIYRSEKDMAVIKKVTEKHL